MLFALCACVENEVNPEGNDDFDTGDPFTLGKDTEPGDSEDTAVDSDSGESGETSTTWYVDETDETGTTIPDDCPVELREAPWEERERIEDITYAEDFTFDNDGSIVIVRYPDIVRQWGDGSMELIYPNFGDSRGILAVDGECWVVSSLNRYALERICADGSQETLASGAYILAITIDDERNVYYEDYTSQTVWRVNLDSLDVELVVENAHGIDGLTWNSYDGGLYLNLNYPGELAVVYPDGSGGWTEPEAVAVPSPYYYLDGITADRCGNIYPVDMFNGIFRYRIDTGEIELMAEWIDGIYTPSAHFGEGYGDFPSDHIYVMDYNGDQLFEFDAGIDGRPNPEVDG